MKLDDSMLYIPMYSTVCTFCKHLHEKSLAVGEHKCKAFDAIPDEIWDGENDHKKPFPGDKGIIFEPIK